MARPDKGDGDEDDPSDAGVTAIRLERLARLLRQSAHAEGLNPSQWDTLRYLTRASRHSRSVMAVGAFLGSTKGTTSQTLSALRRKGLVTRGKNPREPKQDMVALTPKGTALMENDPLKGLAGDIESLGGKTRRRFARGVAELLAASIGREKAHSFGTCADCRYFRESSAGAPALCMKDEQPLAQPETALLCIAHAGR
jgi:DNA-binding MarR family transcriptional regulator